MQGKIYGPADPVSLPAVDTGSLSLADVALWSTKRTAAYIGCSEVAVRTWRRTGIGPVFIRVTPRQVRYRPQDVQRWLQDRTLTSTSSSAER